MSRWPSIHTVVSSLVAVSNSEFWFADPVHWTTYANAQAKCYRYVQQLQTLVDEIKPTASAKFSRPNSCMPISGCQPSSLSARHSAHLVEWFSQIYPPLNRMQIKMIIQADRRTMYRSYECQVYPSVWLKLLKSPFPLLGFIILIHQILLGGVDNLLWCNHLSLSHVTCTEQLKKTVNSN